MTINGDNTVGFYIDLNDIKNDLPQDNDVFTFLSSQNLIPHTLRFFCNSLYGTKKELTTFKNDYDIWFKKYKFMLDY